MAIIVGWVLFSIIPAVIASNRGRSGFGWFCLSILISPLFAGILVACLPPVKAELEQRALAGDMRKCPHCAELVKREAKICRYCQRDLPAEPEAAAPEPIDNTDKASGRRRVPFAPLRCHQCGSDHIIEEVPFAHYACRDCHQGYLVIV